MGIACSKTASMPLLSSFITRPNVPTPRARGDSSSPHAQSEQHRPSCQVLTTLAGDDDRPDAYLMYANRAGCLLELQQYAPALADAKRAVALKPSWATSHMLKARVHEALKQWPDMLGACCDAYAVDADNDTNLAMLRDCLVQHLTDDRLCRRGSAPGSFAEALGRARNDARLRSLLEDPKVRAVLSH